jgi:hypothetical protein
MDKIMDSLKIKIIGKKIILEINKIKIVNQIFNKRIQIFRKMLIKIKLILYKPPKQIFKKKLNNDFN